MAIIKQQMFTLHRWIDSFDGLWRLVVMFSITIIVLGIGALITNMIGIPGQEIYLVEPSTWKGIPVMWMTGALCFCVFFLARLWYNAASYEEVEQVINGEKNART